MNQIQKTIRNEDGFVMVVALMILVILTLIGTAGLENSSFEEQIAGNDWMAKQTFYKSDGGTEIGAEVLEYNFSCGEVKQSKVGRLYVQNSPNQIFYNKKSTWIAAHADETTYPSATNRDLCWASGFENQENPTLADMTSQCSAGANNEQTNIKIFGDIQLNPGSAIQMAAGYEGKGKGAAGGGASYVHDIHSQNRGVRGNEAIIRTQWQHMVGQEDPTGCYNQI